MSNNITQTSHKPSPASRIWPKRLDSQTDGELADGFNAVADEGVTAIEAAPSRILFVCTGNTCRSPMAEGLCTAVAQLLGLEVEATSAGIGATDVSRPSLHAVAVMRERGIEISNHRSRQLRAGSAQAVDLVLAMTSKHAEQARAIVGSAVRVQTLGEYAGVREAVDDPFGGTVERYRRTAEQIHRLLMEALSRGGGK